MPASGRRPVVPPALPLVLLAPVVLTGCFTLGYGSDGALVGVMFEVVDRETAGGSWRVPVNVQVCIDGGFFEGSAGITRAWLRPGATHGEERFAYLSTGIGGGDGMIGGGSWTCGYVGVGYRNASVRSNSLWGIEARALVGETGAGETKTAAQVLLLMIPPQM